MTLPLSHWIELYRRYRNEAYCLDIETTGWNKPISVIGLARAQDGVPDVIQLIKGDSLTRENLIQALYGCRLLITYNGIKFDIRRIRADFPGVIPYGMPVLDLYRFSKRCGIKTDLKTLENTLGIDRLEAFSKKRGIAVRLWKRSQTGDVEALRKLLEYNRQDVINLYPLAEMLIEMAEKPARHDPINNRRPPAFPGIVRSGDWSIEY